MRDWALYTVLAPHDAEQADLLARVAADANLGDVPAHASLVANFGARELMRWPRVRELYATELADVAGFGADGARWAVLQRRVVEHNVRVIAQYYARVHMSRVAQLLDLDVDGAEKYISELVVGKSIYARIDRPSNTVSFSGAHGDVIVSSLTGAFTAPKSHNELLNEWSNSTEQLLRVVENISVRAAMRTRTHSLDRVASHPERENGPRSRR
jgi:26S proteasome regulatory subunit N5